MNTGLTPSFTDVSVASLQTAMRTKRQYDAVLSLQDLYCPRSELLGFTRKPAPAHLRLRFEDDEEGPDAATPEQVAQGLAFVAAATGRLLIHCHHGISRSGAFGYAAWAMRLGPGAEEEALSQLSAQRPEVVPNAHVTGLIDAALGRNGAFLGAYRRRLAADPAWQDRRRLQQEARMQEASRYRRLRDRLC